MQLNKESKLCGLILDFIGVVPNTGLAEFYDGEKLFSKATATRGATYHEAGLSDPLNSDYNVYILDHTNYRSIIQAVKNKKNTNAAIVIKEKISYWQCMCLTLQLRPKEIVRIATSKKHEQVYMSSAGRIERFKRAFINADLGSVGKTLVGLKVALRPLNTYSALVLVI